MIKVGLSGNRYAGKDAVSRLFEQIRVPVFDADIVLKFILNYNFEKASLLKLFSFIFISARANLKQ